MLITASRNMKGSLKPFNSKNYSINDSKGKTAFRNFLNSLHKNGNRTIDNPNQYGIDLLTLNPSGVVVKAWEIEVRENNWTGNRTFPHELVNCIERKEYLWRREQEFYDKIPLEVDKACEVLYVQLNDLCTRAVIIPGSIVLKCRLKPWDNSYCSGEYVRQVPLSKTIQVNLVTTKVVN